MPRTVALRLAKPSALVGLGIFLLGYKEFGLHLGLDLAAHENHRNIRGASKSDLPSGRDSAGCLAAKVRVDVLLEHADWSRVFGWLAGTGDKLSIMSSVWPRKADAGRDSCSGDAASCCMRPVRMRSFPLTAEKIAERPAPAKAICDARYPESLLALEFSAPSAPLRLAPPVELGVEALGLAFAARERPRLLHGRIRHPPNQNGQLRHHTHQM